LVQNTDNQRSISSSITWFLKKQPTVAMLSVKAEYIISINIIKKAI